MFLGTSLAVQLLGHHVLTAKGIGSICGWGTKILLATQCGQKNVFSKRYPFSDIFLCDKYYSSI